MTLTSSLARPARAYSDWFTPAFETYIRPAQNYPSIWRSAGILVLGFVIFLVFGAAILYGFATYIYGLAPQSEQISWSQFNVLVDLMTVTLERGSDPRAMAMMLSTFFAMLIAIWFMMALHRRKLADLLGPRQGFGAGFGKAFLVMAALQMIPISITLSHGLPGLTLQFPPLLWLANLVWAIPLILVQSSSEELLFRGYLQQQLAVRARHPLVWMVLPSVMFGLGHASPDLPMAAQWNYIVWVTVFGLIAADFTRISGSLAPAIGFHFANNLFAMLWARSEDALNGLALFKLIENIVASPFWLEVVALLLVWLITRRWIKPSP